jgi:beta-glucanase (GH16 family)
MALRISASRGRLTLSIVPLALAACTATIHEPTDGMANPDCDSCNRDVHVDAPIADAIVDHAAIDSPAPVDTPAADDATFTVADASDVTADSGGAPNNIMAPGGPAHLTFHDEFDSGSLDPMRWNRWYTNAATINSELQFYGPDSFEFGPGVLRIRADRTAMYGQQYTSGAITSFGSFAQAYGYFEMSARTPAGNGLWPAFWLLPSDQSWPPEIDILEQLGQAPNTIYLTYHWRDSGGMHQANGVPYNGPDYTTGQHTYAVDWRPGVIVWYVDGVERHRVSDSVTSKPMYILANLAVGGSWPVPPDSTTPFPSYYDIDYIRAYQYDSMPAGDVNPIDYGIPTASTYTPSAGSTVNVTARLQVNEPQPSGLLIQAILYDESVMHEIVNMNWTSSVPLGTGAVEHEFAMAIPPGTAPGIYRVSIGVFRPDWSFLRWLNNGIVLTVR